jgi:hypothetical protein
MSTTESLPEWLTPELPVPGGIVLNFVARLDKPEELLATILTWLGLEKRRDEIVFELHEQKHTAATEDDWYLAASETYREFVKVLADPSDLFMYENYVLEKFFSRFNAPDVMRALGFENIQQTTPVPGIDAQRPDRAAEASLG